MRSLSASLLALLFLSAGLAGCTDDPEEDEGGDGGGTPGPSDTSEPGGSRAIVAGAKPLWFLGLQWTFALEHPGRGVTGDVTLAVVAEDDEVWQVAPTNGSETADALMWSLFTHMPPVGPVSKDTFSPHIHGSVVGWFDFPLADGKAWQGADHNGVPVNYTATRVETTLFDGRKATAFAVDGERGGTTWVRYTYTAEAAWFTEFALDGDGDGVFDVLGRMTDARVGAAHLDTPTFEPVDLAFLSEAGIESNLEPATGFTVPADASAVYAFFVLGGGPGRYAAGVTLPGGEDGTFNFTNTNQSFRVAVFGARFPGAPGDGTVRSILLGDGFAFGEVMAVVRNGP